MLGGAARIGADGLDGRRVSGGVSPEHAQDRVDHDAGHADGDRDLPTDIHQLIVAIAGERAAEPDHHVDDHGDFHEEPEEADDRGVYLRNRHDGADGYQRDHYAE